MKRNPAMIHIYLVTPKFTTIQWTTEKKTVNITIVEQRTV